MGSCFSRRRLIVFRTGDTFQLFYVPERARFDVPNFEGPHKVLTIEEDLEEAEILARLNTIDKE